MSIHITMDSVQLMEEFRTNAKSAVHCNDVSVTQSFEVRLSLVATRSSADADNGLDAFVGQSRSTNILGPFQVK